MQTPPIANIRSRLDNINISNYDVTRTFERVTGDVRPGGSRALDGRYRETKKSRTMLRKISGDASREALPRVAKNFSLWVPLHVE
jgi:hypothetical protein